MILTESPRRKRVTKLLNWGHWFAFANIIIAIVIASVFVFSSPPPGTFVGSLYTFSNWLGHISFMTFFGFVIFILPLCYVVNNPSTVKAIASVVAAIGLALLAFDALLYNKTGLHLNSNSAYLLQSDVTTQLDQLSWQQLGFLFLLFIVWLGFQLILANAIWKRINRLNRHRIGTPATTFFIVCFVTSHAMHVWADAQLYQPVIKQDNMFPLSYPATAKTTMSRYGLLDMESYLQRKQLQFDPEVHEIRYPTKPVYCNINANKNIVVLVQTDSSEVTIPASSEVSTFTNYFSTASSIDSLIMSTLFGVPEIYQQSLNERHPILLALPVGLGMPVNVYAEEKLNTQYSTSHEFDIDVKGLQVAFVSGATIQDMAATVVSSQMLFMIVNGFNEKGEPSNGTIWTNLPIKAHMATTEDIAPTVLSALGCNAPVETYSTGQSLISPTRDWLVSTSGEKINVFYDGKRTDVLSNGHYEITDLETSQRSTDSLNTDMLSRAIKHLSRFSQAR